MLSHLAPVAWLHDPCLLYIRLPFSRPIPTHTSLSLKRRAELLVRGLNAIPGIECESADGAMYAFPRITNMPQRAIETAKATGTTPDNMYALSLLEATGICVVPASGFGQAEGRIGFRTTFLPGEEELKVAVTKFAEHHAAFCEMWADDDTELVA
jgi:alanine transaminase